jgi:hypothetical protein
LATISSGLNLLLGIPVLLDAKRHTSSRTTSTRADHNGSATVATLLREQKASHPISPFCDGLNGDGLDYNHNRYRYCCGINRLVYPDYAVSEVLVDASGGEGRRNWVIRKPSFCRASTFV